MHTEGRILPEPEPATAVMALFVTTRAGMERLGPGAGDRYHCEASCDVAVLRELRCERMAGLRVGLWDWGWSWEAQEAELGISSVSMRRTR